jgi:ribosome-associated protein
MDIKKLQSIVIDALEDVKAQDIRVFDTSLQTSLFDRVAVASGTSNRQTKALASSVREKVKEKGGNVLSVEGEETGEWVLVDLGDMIVHIMQPAIRDYYRLEEIWGEKEVKFGAAKRTASTASAKRAAETEEKVPAPRRSRIPAVAVTQALDDEDAPKKAVRKPRAPSTKTAAPKTPVGKTIRVSAPKSAIAPKKSAAKSTSTTAKKAPAKRTPRAAAKPKTA